MKNTIGTSVQLTLFGESHGPAIGVVLDGLAPGIAVDEDFIAAQLARRRPNGRTDTARIEKDEFSILSGVCRGYTTGAPIAITIPNANVRSSDYSVLETVARPAHADYVAHVKYHGFQDRAGGGHFSGRITAGMVAAGAVCIKALERRGIAVATHILRCGGVSDVPFSGDPGELELVNSRDFPVLGDVSADMEAAILAAKSDRNSIGGVIQTCICGMPAGVGEPWFDSLEGAISRAVFAIGGIKGIEFGKGFGLADMYGSEANDEMRYEDGRVITLTNNNGGINGGISNGMPVMFNMAVKPTPSISRSQRTVDFVHGTDTELELTGRHDPAIVRRVCIVVTSMIAVVLCDMLALRFGTDWLAEENISL